MFPTRKQKPMSNLFEHQFAITGAGFDRHVQGPRRWSSMNQKQTANTAVTSALAACDVGFRRHVFERPLFPPDHSPGRQPCVTALGGGRVETRWRQPLGRKFSQVVYFGSDWSHVSFWAPPGVGGKPWLTPTRRLLAFLSRITPGLPQSTP